MKQEKNLQEKKELHQRNKNRKNYDFKALSTSLPALDNFLIKNKAGNQTIDFSNHTAVKLLNKAILRFYYGIQYWDFPDENLCPPIPGRADYLHHIADLLAESNHSVIPKGSKITCLDIGTGASCIYPIIGVSEYQWNFIASDISSKSLNYAKSIVNKNHFIKGKIDLRLQKNPRNIYKNIIKESDRIDVTICNPPFHNSLEDAEKGTLRKNRNLKPNNHKTLNRNFSGQHHELIYKGGEYQFIKNMMIESQRFAKQCYWFTTLVSKKSNLKRLEKVLRDISPKERRIMSIQTGNKSSRILTWRF